MGTTAIDNEMVKAMGDSFSEISEWISGEIYEAAREEGLTDLIDKCNHMSTQCDQCANYIHRLLNKSEENER